MQLIDKDVPGPKRDFVGYGRRPPQVAWPNNAKVAVNLVVNYEEGSEYAKPAGDERNEGLAEINYALDKKISGTSRPSPSTNTAAGPESGGSCASSTNIKFR